MGRRESPRSLAVLALLGGRHGAALLRSWLFSNYYRVFLSLHPAVEGSFRLRVNGPMVWDLHPQGKLRLDGFVRINSRSRQNPISAASTCVISVGKGATLEIGDGAGISGSTIACTHRMSIGAGTLIGSECMLIDTDFHPLQAAERAVPGALGARGAVVIGADAFIGARCTLLKGSGMGREAVLGAASVLTKVAGPGEIWAGSPARKLAQLSRAPAGATRP